MENLTYRDAVRDALAQEMRRDATVCLVGEDVAAAGGVFKATQGLLEEFGPHRVRDTPISEQAIVGLVMGAAMTGLRPVAEIMFADFLTTCWDMIANEIAKMRYMTAGQVTVPLVIRTAQGGGLGFGAQHSQSVESWVASIPGLKVVAPSSPADMKGLLASAIRDPDPVVVLEHKALYPVKGDVPSGEHVVPLGSAATVRGGSDATIVAVGAMVHRAVEAAETLGTHGINAEVIDLRSLIPMDITTVLRSVARTGWLFTVEEGPRVCGWGAELASVVAEEAIFSLDGPIVRITTPHVPLPAAGSLEDAVIPTAHRIAVSVMNAMHHGEVEESRARPRAE